MPYREKAIITLNRIERNKTFFCKLFGCKPENKKNWIEAIIWAGCYNRNFEFQEVVFQQVKYGKGLYIDNTIKFVLDKCLFCKNNFCYLLNSKIINIEKTENILLIKEKLSDQISNLDSIMPLYQFKNIKHSMICSKIGCKFYRLNSKYKICKRCFKIK